MFFVLKTLLIFNHIFSLNLAGVGPETSSLLKSVAEHLTFCWNKLYYLVMGWVKVRMQFATLHATNLCLCGSRTKWKSATEMDNGCKLPVLQYL